MRDRAIAAFSVTAALMLAAPAFAQGQPPRPPTGGQPQRPQPAPPPQAAPKPYQTVAISAPAPLADPSFEAFRKQLAAAVDTKDRKALAGMVAPNFFWMGEKGDKADKKKPGIDNLAKAIGLGGKDAPGWDALGAYAADPTATAFSERKDTVCAPADPNFKPEELEALAKATGTDDADWAYPTQPGLEMHATAQPNSPVVEKLGMHFVRVLEDNAPGAQDSPMVKVVAPSGKTGFVSGDAISPLGNDQLCYSKDGGAWKISGFIGGE